MITGLWLTPFLLRRIGQYDYGVWLVGLQAVAYLALLDFGVVALLPREIAYAAGQALTENLKVPLVLGHAVRLIIDQTVVVAIAVILFWLWMPAAWTAYRGPLLLVTLLFVLLFPLRTFRAVLQGLQDLKYLGKVQISCWMVGTAVTVVMVVAGYGLYALVGGWAATELMSASACFRRLRTEFREFLPGRIPRFSAPAAAGYLRKSGWVSVSQVAQLLLNGADVLILGKLLGPAAVVVYSCTGKLTTVVGNQPQVLMQTALPGLSEMRAGESKERILQVCTALGQAMLLLSGGLVCVVLAINAGFVTWWVGAPVYGGMKLTLILAMSMLLRHGNTVLVYALFALGQEKRLVLNTLIDGVVTTCGALLLVPSFGISGPPLAAIMGASLVSLPLNGWALKNALGIRVGGIVRPFLPWLWRFILVASSTLILVRKSSPGILWTASNALAVAGAYLALNYSLLSDAPLGAYLQPRFRALFVALFGGSGFGRIAPDKDTRESSQPVEAAAPTSR